MNHRTQGFMERPFWKPDVIETRQKAGGIKANDHFKSLLLVQEAIRGVQIIDRDNKEKIPDKKVAFNGNLLKLCWVRYEIESYLVHPDVLARFVAEIVGPTAELADIESMKEAMRKELPGRVVDDPFQHDGLKTIKAREKILPPLLDKAGLSGFPYTRYSEIAAVMKPEEIHPEITDKLDAIADHLGL